MTNNRLHFLKLEIVNHPLISANTEFSLVTYSRVNVDRTDDLTHLFGRIWVNNIATLIGRNASGKTLTMKLTLGILSLMFSNLPINQTHLQEVLIGDQPIKFNVYLYGDDGSLFKDEIAFRPGDNENDGWAICEENVLMKRASESMSKKRLFDFDGAKTLINRNQLSSIESSLLASDDSLMRAVITQHKYVAPIIFDTLLYTDVNLMMYGTENVSTALLEYLDPSIEYVKIEKTKAKQAFYRLKFKNSDNEITDANFGTLRFYLSSGTVKAISLYSYVVRALKSGGIIFIDELENHFHQEIVNNFIELFTEPSINKNRATLIFSTHYAELLDRLSRGDQVYVVRRRKAVTVSRYADIADRQDLLRSEVFTSNYLTGTVPDYDAYMNLRKETARVIGDDK